MSDTKGDAIDDILKVRDQLVVMRERLFQLTAATAARTKKVDGLLDLVEMASTDEPSPCHLAIPIGSRRQAEVLIVEDSLQAPGMVRGTARSRSDETRFH